MIISSKFPLKFFFKERQTSNFLYTQLGNIGWQKVTYLFFKSWIELTCGVSCSVSCIQQPQFGDWKILLRFVASCLKEREVKLKAVISTHHAVIFFYLARNKERKRKGKKKDFCQISAMRKILGPLCSPYVGMHEMAINKKLH